MVSGAMRNDTFVIAYSFFYYIYYRYISIVKCMLDLPNTSPFRLLELLILLKMPHRQERLLQGKILKVNISLSLLRFFAKVGKDNWYLIYICETYFICQVWLLVRTNSLFRSHQRGAFLFYAHLDCLVMARPYYFWWLNRSKIIPEQQRILQGQLYWNRSDKAWLIWVTTYRHAFFIIA